MKTDLHPAIHTTKVTCACGNNFTTLSTVEELSVDVCSMCHPFYTGQQNIVDTAGRVDRFKAAREKAQQLQAEAAKRAAKKQSTATKKDSNTPSTAQKTTPTKSTAKTAKQDDK